MNYHTLENSIIFGRTNPMIVIYLLDSPTSPGKEIREMLETRYAGKSEGLKVERIGGMSMNSWADMLTIKILR